MGRTRKQLGATLWERRRTRNDKAEGSSDYRTTRRGRKATGASIVLAKEQGFSQACGANKRNAPSSKASVTKTLSLRIWQATRRGGLNWKLCYVQVLGTPSFVAHRPSAAETSVGPS
jgi:hypothetical protein